MPEAHDRPGAIAHCQIQHNKLVAFLRKLIGNDSPDCNRVAVLGTVEVGQFTRCMNPGTEPVILNQNLVGHRK